MRERKTQIIEEKRMQLHVRDVSNWFDTREGSSPGKFQGVISTATPTGSLVTNI